MVVKRKVLIIGLDGGDWQVLNQVQKQIRLPIIASLIKQGTSGILQSTLPAITPAAWASFQTGQNPGKTGVFDFSYWDLQTKQKKIVNSHLLPETLWQILSDNNKKVGVMNVPLTYPATPVNGQLVSGMLTPTLKSNFTYPESLKDKLLKQVKDYQIINLDNAKTANPNDNFKGFINHLGKIIKARYKAASYLLANNQYDLFMVHFQANDIIQHALWPYLDPKNELSQSKKSQYIAKKFFRQLDKYIGLLIEEFKQTQGVEPLVLIISDHGFERHKARFNLAQWLSKNGYLQLNPYFKYRKLLNRLNKKVSFIAKDKKYKNYFNWSKSQAFSTGQSGEGFIYLLDKKIKFNLITQLSKIKDPETNQPIIKKIWSREQLYSGNKVNQLPDLIIEPNPGYSFTGTPNNQALFHKVNSKDDFHLGKHRQQGIVIASGPGVKHGKVKGRIIDILPTILYYFKTSVSKDVDGKQINNFYERRQRQETKEGPTA